MVPLTSADRRAGDCSCPRKSAVGVAGAATAALRRFLRSEYASVGIGIHGPVVEADNVGLHVQV